MYCYGCGDKLNDSELFCRNCGAESILSLTEKGRSGSLRQAGYFALGSISFVFLFLIIISFLSTFFPNLGSPQLTLLIMFVLGSTASGSAALYARGRSNRAKRVAGIHGPSAYPAELVTAEPSALAAESFARVPESVVDRTTEKLHIRQT